MAKELEAPKGARGRFQKGVSGNPGGRPKSGEPTALQQLKTLFKAPAEEEIYREILPVVRAVVKAAKEGDMTAAKMLLDRVLPAPKAIDPTLGKALGGIQIIVQGMAEVAMQPDIEGEYETET